MNVHLLIAITTVLFFGTIHFTPANETNSFTFSNRANENANPVKLKWTWQLPAPVRSGFDKTKYRSWCVEKITRYNANDKTVYRLQVNNGNLLDGDHHDSFLETEYLDIADDGIIPGN